MNRTSSLRELEHQSLHDLELACRRETRLYRNGQLSDPRYCLEIFRRALTQISAPGTPTSSYSDEAARDALVQMYSEFIKANINRQSFARWSIDDMVQQVWLRFWRAANKGLEFPSLEAALEYLKRATLSAVIEEHKRHRRDARNESLQEMIEISGEERLTDRGADVFDQHVQQRFRVRCREILGDSLEYRVFWMRYSMGMPPRDIAQVLSREGGQIKKQLPTARLVSDMLERCCNRLSLDLEIRDLLGDD